ncbi:NeuD/PglB/VioB family sugar acetyltransferase [Pseudoalteromonas shioyasakiensis]|uniref:NeuD/PglB/VioB family sugar acetyltransferase n=1 Tax=Pseudoalteromonas shioyasakiensis TaxID=1190813 RepID=A0ABT6U509_9GAMM|nr:MULTISPECIES: NeuD/PglB/VioB family sugar acetyltransferase [Pseudoalteromonas]MDI4671253.1 NeuD/PglB/VioB family sugar acetyltransferase [Pseudoalteromonas shioyasakiensis]MDI4673380.1 NeuD/PglB/VioB family sugar acetyltransferase [Pseudoalteromonas shioyasakiensis]MDI4688162.1 NeuD/PglB/VioB family sugar acetyltransferase [Pseudoalteromonas shioyasakiensis]MDI4706758.1 NeuD/PglB/VioB family sugar acetyltransferase [Pseudoalteromonas shioyasakiensis]NUJ23474.1 NeuD/PglB/VioB family sugar a
MSKPLGYLIIGGGGHAAALAEILLKQGKKLVGIVAPEIIAGQVVFKTIPHFKNDDDVLRFDKQEVMLVNGIGAMPRQNLRERLYHYYTQQGYQFATVIAESALVSEFALLADGVQVMNNAVINIGTRIGENSIINTSSTIDHDCTIGGQCHIAPGVTMSGQVTVENNVHIGTGANIINNVEIGQSAIISVGANVTKPIRKSSVVFGARAVVKGQSYDS